MRRYKANQPHRQGVYASIVGYCRAKIIRDSEVYEAQKIERYAPHLRFKREWGFIFRSIKRRGTVQ